MKIQRRDLLKLSAAFAASAVIPHRALAEDILTKAASPSLTLDNFFILIRLQPGFGGLDVTLGLDPWIQPQRPLETDLFLEYQPNDIKTVGGIHLGPSAIALSKHAKDLLVLNGVFLSDQDNGHGAAIQYMTTGNGQGKAPDFPAALELVSAPSPYGLLAGTDNVYTGQRVLTFVRSDDILSALHSADPTEALQNAVQDPRTPLERAIQEVLGSKAVTAQLRQFLSETEAKKVELKNYHVAAASFVSGASRFAEIDVKTDGQVDTHSDHEKTHLKSQTDLWNKVADVFEFFKSIPYGSGSLFDRTTFMVIADFARTPALNAAKGKDHNPLNNSILFAGYGLQKNKVINASLLIPASRSKTNASYHMASPFDFSTGLPATSRKGANFIYPQNVLITVAKMIGADLTKFGSVPPTTSIIPGFMI